MSGQKKLHVGKTHGEKSQYMRYIRIPKEKEKQTLPGEDVLSTFYTAPESDRKVEKGERRRRPFPKKFKETITNYLWGPLGIICGIFIAVIILLFTLYANLNKDMGKIEERTKDIPVLREKLISIDKRIEIIAVEIKKGYELFNYRLEELNNKFKKIESEKEN